MMNGFGGMKTIIGKNNQFVTYSRGGRLWKSSWKNLPSSSRSPSSSTKRSIHSSTIGTRIHNTMKSRIPNNYTTTYNNYNYILPMDETSKNSSSLLFLISFSTLCSILSMKYDTTTTNHSCNIIKCEGNNAQENEEVEYNEEDERSCPFCRYFLDSPCKDTFIKWQQCVKVSTVYSNITLVFSYCLFLEFVFILF
jgi:hypothetical protein